MATFSPGEQAVCHILIDLALAEDLGAAGDVTGQALVPPEAEGQAILVARSPGVLAGLEAARLVFEAVDADLAFEPVKHDADALEQGSVVARIRGPLQALLAAERTALNFVQRLSGVATLTRRYVDAVAGLRVRILDTRKTTPGWRLLEKYAVRCGGGDNHRTGLYDMILIKDNHLAGLRLPDARTEVAEALARARGFREELGAELPLEIEVDSLEQLDAALACRADIVLLDNMSPATMREAVRRRDSVAPGVLLEASGGINLQTVRAVAESGVDRISVGALTHSAPALDLALDFDE